MSISSGSGGAGASGMGASSSSSDASAMAHYTGCSGSGLRLDVPGRDLMEGFECPGLRHGIATVHAAEDWRRHALFMTTSKVPSSVVLACARMQAAEDGHVAGLQK